MKYLANNIDIYTVARVGGEADLNLNMKDNKLHGYVKIKIKRHQYLTGYRPKID